MNTKRIIFTTLKQALMPEGNSRTRFDRAVAANFGTSKEVMVLGDLEVEVPGPIAGGEWRNGRNVDIHPGSIVDNRPETQDVVEFSFSDQKYRSTESNLFQDGAVVRTDYSLKRESDGEWVEIDSLA